LWTGVVGDSGTGKSPGADCLMRQLLPPIEQNMIGDFADRLLGWSVEQDLSKVDLDAWRANAREAKKKGNPVPSRPAPFEEDEPQAPCLIQRDVTIEKVAMLLATSAPKGLLIPRDELAGWIRGMRNYNSAGREFWIEAYGGRPHRVGRQKYTKPIDIPRLVVGVYGGTQPDKLTLLMKDADDGLLARILWSWPAPIEFRIGAIAPNAPWAINALDRLRMLDLTTGPAPEPIRVAAESDGRALLEKFGREMQRAQKDAGGLMRSAYGKARGQALRLSLGLEFLWWCGLDGAASPPTTISVRALTAATTLMSEYFMKMAEAVYGDAAVLPLERNAATLARWIFRSGATEIYVRDMQRKIRLPDLRVADDIRAAGDMLVDADWLVPPPPGSNSGRARVAYKVNPRVHEIGKPPPGNCDTADPADPTEEPVPESSPIDGDIAGSVDTTGEPTMDAAPINDESSADTADPDTIEEPTPAGPTSAAAPNGDAAASIAKPPLSRLEQSIIEYDQVFPGLSLETIARTFGQPKGDVATLLGRQE
jgi:hypothetical protein